MYDQTTTAPPELEEIRCPSCGGLNRAGAQWCGQCLERFVPPKPLEIPGRSAEAGPPPPPPPPGGSEPAAAPAVEALKDLAQDPPAPTQPSTSLQTESFSVGADGISWACKHCETVNSLESEVCSVCGMSFAELLRPPAPAKPKRDPNTVALISLFWPGAGHGYLGEWGQAIARGVVSFWVLIVTAVSYAQSGIGAMTTIFGTIGFGLWVVAAHDSFQEASNARDKVILKQKYFLWIVLGLLVLLMGMLLMQGLQASAASR
jgi:hypothetical protein